MNKVFLIEDELDILYLYKTALKAADIAVETASSGKEAMEKVKNMQKKKEEKPSLILLDLVLPDINGLEILSSIRENSVTKDIVVFILSNYTSDALLNIKDIKPNKFIVKSSVTPTQLVDIVKQQISPVKNVKV